VEPSIARDLEEVRRELHEIQADFYTNQRTGAKGVLDRLSRVEERLNDLKRRYENEKADEGFFEKVNDRLNALEVNDRLILLYAKGGAWALGGTLLTLLGAAVVGILRYAVGQ